MNWLTIVKLFSGPLGNIITTGMATASGAAITYAVQKGVAVETATAVVGAVGFIIATAINAATGTQIVQIQNVRENQTNGVTVVPVVEARRAGIPSVDQPIEINQNAG